MRILLYVTTHMTHTHLECLICWSEMLSHTRVLRGADVHILAASLKSNHTHLNWHYDYASYLEEWRAAASRLPNPSVRLSTVLNPGYQEGAIMAMDEALRHGWFDGYDWVVRLNPDVMVVDEQPLVAFLQQPWTRGVFANCQYEPLRNCTDVARGRGCADGVMHTDFFAFRPDAGINGAAFSVWRNSTRGDLGAARYGVARYGVLAAYQKGKDAWYVSGVNAESQATLAFQPIIASEGDAWLVPHKRRDSPIGCRIMDGGIFHVHYSQAHALTCGRHCHGWQSRTPRQLWAALTEMNASTLENSYAGGGAVGVPQWRAKNRPV